ncbi:hypothetical protein NL676_024183 [Syzygium grande]|nr:hypothetical protein NL676_024183 [Syzygium grande]
MTLSRPDPIGPRHPTAIALSGGQRSLHDERRATDRRLRSPPALSKFPRHRFPAPAPPPFLSTHHQSPPTLNPRHPVPGHPRFELASEAADFELPPRFRRGRNQADDRASRSQADADDELASVLARLLSKHCPTRLRCSCSAGDRTRC